MRGALTPLVVLVVIGLIFFIIRYIAKNPGSVKNLPGQLPNLIKKVLSSGDFWIPLISVPIIQWLLWSFSNDRWEAFWDSGRFFPVIIAAFLIAWIWKRKPWWSATGVGLMTAGSLAVMFFPSKESTVKDNLKIVALSALETVHYGPGSGVTGEVSILSGHVFRALCTDTAMVERILREFSGDTTMANIAAAESNCRHQVGDSVVTNENANGTKDRGLWQINDARRFLADSLGVNYMTLDGNFAVAKELLKRNPDYSDWDSSRRCWEMRICGRQPTTVGSVPQTPIFQLTLGEGEKELQVPADQPSQRILMIRGTRTNFWPLIWKGPYLVIDESGKQYRIETDSICPAVDTPSNMVAFQAIDSAFVMLVEKVSYDDTRFIDRGCKK